MNPRFFVGCGGAARCSPRLFREARPLQPVRTRETAYHRPSSIRTYEGWRILPLWDEHLYRRRLRLGHRACGHLRAQYAGCRPVACLRGTDRRAIRDFHREAHVGLRTLEIVRLQLRCDRRRQSYRCSGFVFSLPAASGGYCQGIYYCIIDPRNEGNQGHVDWTGRISNAYFDLIQRQMQELHSRYGPIGLQIIDIPGKLSPDQRWQLYREVKARDPHCLITLAI